MSTFALRLLRPLNKVRPWPWPLPALAAWALCFAVWHGARWAGLGMPLAYTLGGATGALLALAARGMLRRGLVAAGFPLAALAQGAAVGLPGWAWLLALLPLLLAYPLRAWRDAPLFPTPAAALEGLRSVVGAPRHVLDAGCGLGHGLRALRAEWPLARVHGVEWSPLLAWATRLLCPWAHVRRADMWKPSWGGYDLVYLFQRPESMARAWAKACGEMAEGSWLVSLEFAVPGVRPHARLQQPGGRPVWIYRIGGSTRAARSR